MWRGAGEPASSVEKGLRVQLSEAFDAQIREAGAAHSQHMLLDQEGIVTAIGADRSACMVKFGDKVHKLLIGRGGAFQLAVSTHEGGGHGRAKQDAAVHEASRTKSALSGDLIGLELTLSEGEVHVTDVLPSIEGNIRKGDRVLEIASRPVGETLASLDGLLQEIRRSDADRVDLRFVKMAGMGIFGASVESIKMPVRGRKHVSAVSSAPDACNDPRLSWLGIRWHLTNKKVAVQTVIAGKAAAKTAKIMVGDDLLKVDEEQAAATVTGVNKQLARALTTKPMVTLHLQRTGLYGIGQNLLKVQVYLDEWVMDGETVEKGIGARLSREHRERIGATGETHEHFKIYVLNPTGIVTAIGLDKEACMVDFPSIGVQKMLIGRRDQDGQQCYQLAHADPMPIGRGSHDRPSLVGDTLGLILSAQETQILVEEVLADGPSRRDGRIQKGDILTLVGEKKLSGKIDKLYMPQGVGESVAVSLRRSTIFGQNVISFQLQLADERVLESLVDGKSVQKGAVVCLSAEYEKEVRKIVRESQDGTAANHPHAALLGAQGKVKAVGADKEACMVDFGRLGVHKMLVGRKGSFQLAEVSGKTVKETAGGASENPSAHSAVLGTFSDSGSPLAHKRPIPEVHRAGAPKLLEELVTGREVTKGARVKLSNAYVSEIKKTGSGHVHYSLIGINGVVSMIGADKQACQVIFRVASCERKERMLIGRDGAFQLAHITKFSTDEIEVQDASGAAATVPIISAGTVSQRPSSSAPDGTSSHAKELTGTRTGSSIGTPSTASMSDDAPRGLGLMVAEKDSRVYISSIAKGSAAEAIGPYLRVGDQVDSIDGHEISSKADFMRLAAGEKGMSRRLQVSRVRGRGGAGEGGVICAGGSDRRLIFMMSIILGMPGCHTIYGNSSSVLGGTMDVVAFPKTPESEEEGPENRETQAEGTGPVITHALRALPPTPTTNSEEPSDAPQKQNTVTHNAWVPELCSLQDLDPSSPEHSSPTLRTDDSRGPPDTTPSVTHATPTLTPLPKQRDDLSCGSLSPEKMPSTINFDRLEIMVPPIGNGSYKTVYKALLDESKPVAALAIRARSARLALAEVAMLHQLKPHPNLPVLYGVARDHANGVWLVQEYFPLGGLDMQLEVWEGMLSVTTRLCILQQVCEAMMSLRLQGVLHRDLSSRNILVHSLHASSVLDVWVKVSDFGLACVLEDVDGSKVCREEGDDLPIPWRWTAPEVYLEECWYWKSDVWSFGVTMWEVFTYALIPYLDMSDDELQREVLVHGHRLPPPEVCPEGVYALMQQCWSSKPHDRPSWTQIAAALSELLEAAEEDSEFDRFLF